MGAASLIQILMKAVSPGMTEVTPEDEAMMEGIHTELTAFFKALREGRPR